MDESTAAFWLQTLTAIVAAVWVVAAVFVARTQPKVNAPQEGEVTVQLPPRLLAAHCLRSLANEVQGSMFFGADIDGITEEQVRWTSKIAGRHHCTVSITGDSQHSVARWSIESHTGLLTAARVILTIAVLLIVGLNYGFQAYVLPSKDAATRGQVLHMGQSIHLLWPPMVIAAAARSVRKKLQRDMLRILQSA